MIKKNRNKALSMIELLLWLAVVAIIMISLARFFKTDQYSAEVTQTMAKVAKVNAGFVQYLSTTIPQSYVPWPMSNIINAQYASEIDFKAPWPYTSSDKTNNPKSYSIATFIHWTDKTQVANMQFYIYIYGVPSAICQQINNQLLQAGYNLSQSPKCHSDKTTDLKAQFSF